LSTLNLAYQCKWCNDQELWLGHNCRSCGSKTGKCRAPKWDRIRATVSSEDNPEYNTTVFLNGTSSQCCGAGISVSNAFAGVNGSMWSDNPFAQNGIRCRYRSYAENTTDYAKFCLVNSVPQPRIPLYSITTCQHWVYNLHWHYWSVLDSVQVYLSRLPNDSCRWRVTLRVSGVHLLSHTFQYRTGVPAADCAGQFVGDPAVYIGTKSINITTPSTCEPVPCDLLPNANCAMPDFLTSIEPSVLNLASQSAFTYWMSRDVDDLTDETLGFNRTAHAALQHCNVYPVNSVPTIPSTTCPTPTNRTFGRETAWEFAGDCEGCQLQQQYAGGLEIVESETTAYSFAQAIWDSWNVTFAFV